ncbi:MAG: bifunctional aldolase/short-chain dehydrogenase [Caldilineaceae bacterium]|nr:bifunctional aldolase/short-chain dehydrogenase [Caldilineaceae bacterium]
MQSLWNDQDAAQYDDDLGLRVYTSRLLGREPALVLHGGGNTSVKVREPNLFGDEEEILYIKGSGWDLATIERAGFAPVRQAAVLRLAELEELSDSRMANELRTAMTRASAPSPSVETILHAALPFKFVDHSHADAVVTITNSARGRARIEELYGDRVVIIPYIMPGFKLARLVAEIFPAEAHAGTVGMVLLNHGLFTFGATARESYERHIALVDEAEDYLAAQGVWQIAAPDLPPDTPPARQTLADLRRDLSAAAGYPVILATHRDEQARAFVSRPDLATIARQGPATPDHVLRTKRLPLVGHDVDAYVADYTAQFEAYAARHSADLVMVDPAPRVILDPALGFCTVGRTVKDAAIAEDIYRHTMEIIARATALDAYQALPADDLFDMEYWELEQAKLRLQAKPAVFTGEIALVTGAASGIGKACAQALLDRGAAVVGLDVAPDIAATFPGHTFLGLRCDITDGAAVDAALDAAVQRFGGLDMVVVNAGIFPSSKRIADLDLAEWQRVLDINLTAHVMLLGKAHPLLKAAPNGGRVVVIGSKNVPAPGPGAAAYSASKSALTQMARIIAMEWGGDGIRINVIHPNAVFDTALWTEELLRTRAANYGLTVDEYKRNNILGVEVTSRAVGEMAATMCGPTFAWTTGAQVPLDGGNERVI